MTDSVEQALWKKTNQHLQVWENAETDATAKHSERIENIKTHPSSLALSQQRIENFLNTDGTVICNETLPNYPARYAQKDSDLRFTGGSFFKPGCVFALRWNEVDPRKDPLTRNRGMWKGDWFKGDDGEYLWSGVRVMVVFKNLDGYTLCVRCGSLTHGNWREADSHGRIRDRRMTVSTPEQQSSTIKPEVTVDMAETGHGVLEPDAYLNYDMVYKVDWNVQVKSVGQITEKTMEDFLNNVTYMSLQEKGTLEDEATAQEEGTPEEAMQHLSLADRPRPDIKSKL